MAKVSIRASAQAEPVASPQGAVNVESCAYFDKASQPIHLQEHRLGKDASLCLRADCAPVAMYVWRGTVHAGSTRLARGAGAVIEYGAGLQLETRGEPADVLVFHSNRAGAELPGDARVHLLPADSVPRSAQLGGHAGIGGAMYANAERPAEHVWLHETNWQMGDSETALHSHSEDEVIFIIAGSMRLGNRVLEPGTALAIAADVKYGFRTGPDGLAFLNFRGRSPTYSTADGLVSKDEAKLWNDMLGRPDYVECAAS